MTEKPEDAPYEVMYDVLTIDGKKRAVYRLGGPGVKRLRNAVCKDQCAIRKQQFNEAQWNLEQEIKGLKSMLNVLTDLIGGSSAMVEYFKRHILIQIADKSCRTDALTHKPYSDFKYVALQELLKENKVTHTRNGWWKLARI